LILRRCGSGREVAKQGFRCNPASHLAAHHAAFSASAFCKAQLILRSCGANGGADAARSSAWQALHLSLTFSSGRIAAHLAAFSASAFCECAIDFAVMREGVAGR